MSKIKVVCNDKEYRKYASNILCIFYLFKNIEFVNTSTDLVDIREDKLDVIKIDGQVKLSYTNKGRVYETAIKDNDIKEDRSKTIKKHIFLFLNSVKKQKLPWGFMTGVRPVKMATNMFFNDLTKKEAKNAIQSDFLVSPKIANLLTDLAEKDISFFGNRGVIDDSVSLYISIPFCPDRCTYCSFNSYPYAKYKDLAYKYVDSLISELHRIKDGLQNEGKYIKSIYIGGGTPAVLSTDLTDKLLRTTDVLCTSKTLEVTFEAGRPEVFDDEKQKVLKNHFVTRICINPQSMDDNILKAMGRNHTVKDIYRCFDIAVKNGFNNINTDMIVGLPGESLESFSNNLNALLNLGQQSVTVHTLAMKRKAVLMENNNAQNIVNNNDIDVMLEITENELKNKGYEPYYLYRQKMSVGNRENIGYCKKGYECIYNMLMIGERQTVIGAGAGATSRFVSPDLTVTRSCNKKLVDQYIREIEN